MTQPTAYNRVYDFDGYQTANPNDPLPSGQVEAELDAIEITLDATLANLALIQRDDTLLANATVHPDALTTATLALVGGGWTPQGEWATSTAYVASDVATQGGKTYVCVTAHTSGTFSTDLIAGKWIAFGNTRGYTAKSVAGAVDVTLNASEYTDLILEFTGALTGSISVILPASEDNWIIYNNTTGAYTLTAKVTGQSGVGITQGTKRAVYCDGTDVRAVMASPLTASEGGTGLTALSANVVTLLGSATFAAFLTSLGLTPSANGTSLIEAANYAAMKTLLDLEIGTDVQAQNATLTALATVMSSTATAAAQRAAIGLDTGNTPDFTGLTFGGAGSTLANYAHSQTWTPVLLVGGSNKTTAAYGQYIRVGNLCWISSQISANRGTDTGVISITGLPFTAANTLHVPVAIQVNDNVDPYNGGNLAQFRVAVNSTTIAAYSAPKSGSWSLAGLDGSTFMSASASCTFNLSGCYEIA